MHLHCFLLLLLLSQQGLAAARPKQPAAFDSALNALPPYRLWTFRQTDCIAGQFPEETGATLPFDRSLDHTACPSRGNASHPFANAAVGVSVTNTLQGGVIQTPLFGSNNFNEIHDNPANNSMSIVMWLTKTQATTGSSFLLEIGPQDATVADVGPAVTQNKLQVKITSSFLQLFFLNGASPVLATCTTFLPPTVFNSFEGASGTFFIALTISSGSFKVYLGKNGILSTCENTDSLYTRFTLKSSVDSALRLGGPKFASVASQAFLADYHMLAFYHYQLTQANAQALFDAGMPNSIPVPPSAPHLFVVGEDLPASQNFAGLFTQGDAVYDEDVNSITAIKLLSVPQASKGVLKVGNQVLAVNDIVTNPSTISFHQTTPEVFSTLNPMCNGAGDPFATFTFKASDGLGDTPEVCTNTTSTPDTCLSPVVGVAHVCVKEMNDAPEVVDGGLMVIQLAASTRASIAISCKDRDVGVAYFGMQGVRLLNQTNPMLGHAEFSFNGTCNGTAIVLPSNLIGATAPADTKVTTTLCYTAEPTSLAQTVIGTDRIYYQCVDNGGLTATSFVDVEIRNALLAGCGSAELADQVKCPSYGREDFPVPVTLKGYDAVVSHNNMTRKLYRIDSLPTNGKLYEKRALTIVYNDITSTDGYRITNLAVVPMLNISNTIVANEVTGFGDLIFIPDRDYFNGICALNKDAPNDPQQINSTSCPGTLGAPIGSFLNGLDVGLNNCNNTKGCPLTFSYSLGYKEPVSEQNVFSPSLVNGSEIFVFGMNDGPTFFDGPSEVVLMETNTKYAIANFKNKVSGNSLVLRDPDADTYRVGFKIAFGSVKVNLPVGFYNPMVSGNRRITLFEGFDCYENGCGVSIAGRAYVSDLNRVFDKLQAETSNVNINDTLVVKIWDPVSSPEETSPAKSIVESIEKATLVHSIHLRILGTGQATGSDGALTGALWAGIAAAIFFVLMSCCACFGCIFGKAKQGSKAALWVVRNVLCTEVKDPQHKKAELSNAVAGGRRSLEQAIHAEHARMARVLCCALFMSRVFPCIKIKAQDTIPDEEDMMKEALSGESKRIALRHAPRDGYEQTTKITAVDLDGDGVVDVVVLDNMEDDSESIFNWERHVDANNRVFYYNTKTNVSSWTPPTVKVDQGQVTVAHRASLSRRNSGLQQPLQATPPAQPKLTPTPPTMPKPNAAPPPVAKFTPKPPSTPNTHKAVDLAGGEEEDRVKGGK